MNTKNDALKPIMPPRKKATTGTTGGKKKKTTTAAKKTDEDAPEEGGLEEDSKMDDEMDELINAPMTTTTTTTTTTREEEEEDAGKKNDGGATANDDAGGEKRQTQLELWEKENELNLLHLSTDAENDELMQANAGHPQYGSELFLGGVPKSASEGDVEMLFKGGGGTKGRGKRRECPSQPMEIQVVKDPNDSMRNRGYAFARFANRGECEAAFQFFGEDDGANAIMLDAENNNEEKKIRATIKPTKHVLFMTGFPPFATREDIVTELLKVGGGGVETVSLPRASGTGTNGIACRHKGYGFVDYFNQECAERAMKNINDKTTRMFNGNANKPVVAKWADVSKEKPLSKEDLLAQSKAVYVGQIPTEGVALDEKDLEGKLREVFCQFGEVEAVKLPRGDVTKGYAFVHFTERSSAEKAVEAAASVSGANAGDESAMDGVVATGAVQLQGCNLTVEIARPERERNHNDHRDRERGGPRGPRGRGGRRMMHRGGRGGPPGAPRGGDYNNYMSPHGGGIAPRQFGGGNSMTPVYLPNGQTAYVMGQGNMPAPNAGWGRQSVTDRLDRGDRGRGGGGRRGRDRGPQDYDDHYYGRGGGGRRRDDSRDAPMHRARPY